jgi:hypothetical protein
MHHNPEENGAVYSPGTMATTFTNTWFYNPEDNNE